MCANFQFKSAEWDAVFLIRILSKIQCTLFRKIANFVNILLSNNIFMQENRAFKNISAGKVHIFC